MVVRVNQHMIPHDPHPNYKPIMRKKAGLPGLFAFLNHEHSMHHLSRPQAQAPALADPIARPTPLVRYHRCGSQI